LRAVSFVLCDAMSVLSSDINTRARTNSGADSLSARGPSARDHDNGDVHAAPIAQGLSPRASIERERMEAAGDVG